jgi:tRNA threonylcarbamoyladenosine biosynthesis protein TsaB
MTLLALEFSSDRRSVALARGGEVLAEALQQTAARTTDALGMIEKVLAQANMAREEIEVVAVGLGPGSYTGIRAAIAVAQGWQLARGVKLLGVSSVAAIAAQAQAEKITGVVHVAVDAQRGEFYLGTWEISADRRVELVPLRIVPATEVEALKRDGKICLGPEQSGFFPAASAVARLAMGCEEFVLGVDLAPIYLRETAFLKPPPARMI